MSLSNKINEDLKFAMKAKNQGALRATRAIKSAILLFKTQGKENEITENDEVQILQRLAKQRRESIEIYKRQNRADLVQIEMEELEVITSYLPKQLSAAEIEEKLSEIIHETEANSMADMGKVMPLAMKKFSSQADGKTISEIVKRLLS